jgi:hypothetical protein
LIAFLDSCRILGDLGELANFPETSMTFPLRSDEIALLASNLFAILSHGIHDLTLETPTRRDLRSVLLGRFLLPSEV